MSLYHRIDKVVARTEIQQVVTSAIQVIVTIQAAGESMDNSEEIVLAKVRRNPTLITDTTCGPVVCVCGLYREVATLEVDCNVLLAIWGQGGWLLQRGGCLIW